MIQFRLWLETSSHALYDSAVAAFPRTRKRQHAVAPINITALEWIAYTGLKTLYVKGLAQNSENGHEHRPMVLFKGVNYEPERDAVRLVIRDNLYTVEQLEYGRNDVQVRCDCPDFRYRFAYYDHLDRSLYGRKPKEYQSQGGPPANPLEMPGMCKHVMALLRTLGDSGLIV